MELTGAHIGTEAIIDQETNQEMYRVSVALLLTPDEYHSFKTRFKGHEVRLRYE